jgi:hypothetical protein
MNRLRPAQLHVRRMPGTDVDGPALPRCYTLTHSDRTGQLYLTIGPVHDRAQIRGWYTRLMRDEVLAEWQAGDDGPTLHVHCHVSGGLAFGSARWRDAILRHEMPLVLEALRYGDRALYAAHPALDEATILVHLHSSKRAWDRIEPWGTPSDYA